MGWSAIEEEEEEEERVLCGQIVDVCRFKGNTCQTA
jgi:hypothetical protein